MPALCRGDVRHGRAPRPHLRLLHFTAGEHVVDRTHEVLVGGTAIQDVGRAGLNQEHFADLADAEAFRNELRLIHQHGNIEPVLVELLLH